MKYNLLLQHQISTVDSFISNIQFFNSYLAVYTSTFFMRHDLNDWELSNTDQISIREENIFLPERHWELIFLFLCSFLFAIWFGITAETFEDIMGYCTIFVFVGLFFYAFGIFSENVSFHQNTFNIMILCIFFSLSSMISHFLGLKLTTSQIM